MNIAGDGTRLSDVEVVRSLQKSRRPIDEAPTPERAQTAADHDVERRFLLPKEFQTGDQRGLDVLDDGVQAAPARLSDRQKNDDSDDDAGHAESEERRPPVVRVRNGARPVGAQPSADRRTECENGHGHGAPVRRKAIRDNGGGRPRAPGLPYTDAGTAQRELNGPRR